MTNPDTIEAVARWLCREFGGDPARVIGTQTVPDSDNAETIHRAWQLYTPGAQRLVEALKAEGMVIEKLPTAFGHTSWARWARENPMAAPPPPPLKGK